MAIRYDSACLPCPANYGTGQNVEEEAVDDVPAHVVTQTLGISEVELLDLGQGLVVGVSTMFGPTLIYVLCCT